MDTKPSWLQLPVLMLLMGFREPHKENRPETVPSSPRQV